MSRDQVMCRCVIFHSHQEVNYFLDHNRRSSRHIVVVINLFHEIRGILNVLVYDLMYIMNRIDHLKCILKVFMTFLTALEFWNHLYF